MFDIKAMYEAQSVSDAVRLRLERPEAQIIAGGSDVLVQVREGKRAGKELISIYGLDELRGVRLDEGDFFHIDSASTSAFDLTADFGKRASTVDTALTLPTLTSTWFELAPGEHTLRNDVGSGAVTVTYDERWL